VVGLGSVQYSILRQAVARNPACDVYKFRQRRDVRLEDYLDTRAGSIAIAQLGDILVRDDRAKLEDGGQMSGVAVVDFLGLDKCWDLIVGVDGYRVKNIFELMQALRDVQSGDRVYLTIVRKGRRMLIVLVPQ
jgi:hypothetical protein